MFPVDSSTTMPLFEMDPPLKTVNSFRVNSHSSGTINWAHMVEGRCGQNSKNNKTNLMRVDSHTTVHQWRQPWVHILLKARLPQFSKIHHLCSPSPEGKCHRVTNISSNLNLDCSNWAETPLILITSVLSSSCWTLSPPTTARNCKSRCLWFPSLSSQFRHLTWKSHFQQQVGWGTRLSQLSLVIPIFDQDLSMSQIVGGTGVVIPRSDQRF